jgi:hypothetical protein
VMTAAAGSGGALGHSQPNAVIQNQDDQGDHNPDDDGGGKLRWREAAGHGRATYIAHSLILGASASLASFSQFSASANQNARSPALAACMVRNAYWTTFISYRGAKIGV